MPPDQQLLNRARRRIGLQQQLGIDFRLRSWSAAVDRPADQERALASHLVLLLELGNQSGERSSLVALVGLG